MEIAIGGSSIEVIYVVKYVGHFHSGRRLEGWKYPGEALLSGDGNLSFHSGHRWERVVISW